MERVWGPVNGFHFAAYAAPAGDGASWCSYVKVCWDRPPDYWEADCAFKLFGGADYATAEEALDAVERLASGTLWQLPPGTRALAARRRQDRRPMSRRWVNTLVRHQLG